MIRKPPGTEQESKAHSTVRQTIDAGSRVADAADAGGRMLGRGCLLFVAVGMGFGLLTSRTPLWFKALMLAAGYGIYRLIKAAGRRG